MNTEMGFMESIRSVQTGKDKILEADAKFVLLKPQKWEIKPSKKRKTEISAHDMNKTFCREVWRC